MLINPVITDGWVCSGYKDNSVDGGGCMRPGASALRFETDTGTHYWCRECLGKQLQADPSKVFGTLDSGSAKGNDRKVACNSCGVTIDPGDDAYCNDCRGRTDCHNCGYETSILYCSASCDEDHECGAECANCGDGASYCSASCALDSGSTVSCYSCADDVRHPYCSASCAVDDGKPGTCGDCDHDVVATYTCGTDGCPGNKSVGVVPALAAASPVIQTKTSVNDETGAVTLDGVEFRF